MSRWSRRRGASETFRASAIHLSFPSCRADHDGPLQVGSRVTDARVGAPTNRIHGEIPTTAIEIAQESFTDLGLVGLLLAAGAPGTPAWSIARGWANLEQAELLRIHHRFPALGATQPVTATVVLRLVAAGRIGLGDPANEHLRTVRLADDAVTIRELLSHTAGVDNSAEPLADTVPELAALTGPVIACNDARGTFHYSNEGYAALGQLITDITGSPYPDVAWQLVLEPLQMNHSGFPVTPDTILDAITHYKLTPEGSFAPIRARVSTMPAADGLYTTAGDLVRFGGGWSSLLPAALARQAVRPHARQPGHTAQRGLGWIINRPRSFIGTGGGTPGACASLLIDTVDHRGHVGFTNRLARIEPINGRVLRACAAPANGEK